MIDLKLPPSKTFTTQEEVDAYILETEKLAEETFDEESAIELYQRVSRLRTVESLFFVPAVVLSWEEMALSMIESEAAIFELVPYQHMCEIHKKGFEAFSNLETHVLNDYIPEEALFGMIHGFNVDLLSFNKYCKKYHQETLDYYKCQNDELQKRYIIWSNNKKYYKEES